MHAGKVIGALDWLWRRVAVQRQTLLLICRDARTDSVFVALCALCQCYSVSRPAVGAAGAVGCGESTAGGGGGSGVFRMKLRVRPAGMGELIGAHVRIIRTCAYDSS